MKGFKDMPKFTVEQSTKLSADDCFAKMKTFMSSKDNDIRKFDPKMDISFEDAKKSCEIKGIQFKAQVQVTPDGGGSKAQITVDLPLLLTPFKGTIEGMLKDNLNKLFR